MYTMRAIKEISAAGWSCITFLAVAAYYDIRYRKIPLKLVIAASVAAVTVTLFMHSRTIWAYAGGVAVGAVMLLVSRLTAESIGYGDGMACMITGLLLGARDTILLLCISFTLSALYSVGLLVCRKGNRKTAIPFLPFLLAGCIIVVLWQMKIVGKV